MIFIAVCKDKAFVLSTCEMACSQEEDFCKPATSVTGFLDEDSVSYKSVVGQHPHEGRLYQVRTTAEITTSLIDL